MRRLILTLLAALVSISAFSQADTLYLSDIYTTHIRYSTEIVYVDIASTDLVVAKQVEQNKNILAIRARVPFPGCSSFTVIEANEAIHTYIVCYRKSPKDLVIEAGRKNASLPPVSASETSSNYNTMASVEKAIANGGLNIPEGRGFSLSTALAEPKALYHLSDKAYDITVSCDNIIIYKDQIFFVVSLQNKSGMAYNCPDAVFVIEPKVRNSKHLSDDKQIYHRNSSGNLSCAPGKTSKVAYSFDVFTILKDQNLKIYLNEIGGQRELCVTLDYKDVNKARIW